MKNGAIITIGTEVMEGKIDDINASFISRWFFEININTKKRITVCDNIDEIKEALKYCHDCDIIIITGGLGPTADDITREACSQYFHKKLIFNQLEWNQIVTYFKKNNIQIPESNKKQAYIIEDFEPIRNEYGTACGMYYKALDNKIYILLPGPPKENQPMLRNYVQQKLIEQNFIEGEFFTKTFRVYNTSESSIADIFNNFKNDDIEIGYYFNTNGWIEIQLKKYLKHKTDITIILPKIKNFIDTLNNHHIFWTEDKDISEIVYELLINKKLNISFAESVTGGLLSYNIVQNSGASKIFNGSIVAYSNESKISLLNVKQETLSKSGAVSEETAKEMVYGIKKIFNTNICISVTGIAGPTGETENKPIGLVYIGFLFNDNLIIKKEKFSGDRARILSKIKNYIFIELIKYLTNYN